MPYNVELTEEQETMINRFAKVTGEAISPATIAKLAKVGAGRLMALHRLAVRKSRERKIRAGKAKGEAPVFKPYAPANAPDDLRAAVHALAPAPVAKPPRVKKAKPAAPAGEAVPENPTPEKE